MQTHERTHPLGLRDVAAEALSLAGGGRALLLQIAHPAVGRGVVNHSDFANRIMDRLHATMTFIYASVYATPEEFVQVRRAVNRAHAPVHAAAAAETNQPAYNAYDPDLQLWVAATLYETMVTLYERVYGPLSPEDGERVYREFNAVASALQVDPETWPADRGAFSAYWESVLPTLQSTAATRSIAGQILSPRGIPIWLKVLLPHARLVTTGLLPDPLRQEFGLPWNDRAAHRYDRWMRWTAAVYPHIPAFFRHRPKQVYLARLRRHIASGREGSPHS